MQKSDILEYILKHIFANILKHIFAYLLEHIFANILKQIYLNTSLQNDETQRRRVTASLKLTACSIEERQGSNCLLHASYISLYLSMTLNMGMYSNREAESFRCCSCCSRILYASYISVHLRKTPFIFMNIYSTWYKYIGLGNCLLQINCLLY